DAHFGLGLTMHRGTPFADDVELREEGVVRIYDIFFDYEVLLSTDAYIRDVSAGPEFQRPMSTAEYHYLLGGYILEREKALGISRKSVLGVAHQCAVPIYTSSPGDSSIGMNVAVRWGKVDPDKLPGTVVCYLDNTVGFPILAAYALAKRKKRRLKRLYERREEMMRQLTEAYQEAKADRDARAEGTTVGRRP